MNRYTAVVHKQRPVGIYVPSLAERDDGNAVLFSDLQAWALKHKATVVNMPHEYNCASQEAKPRFTAKQNPCNCPRGDALLEIEELLK